MAKLFIGGISPNFTELQVAELLAIHGEIQTIKLIYDRKTKKTKGFGFVEMASSEGALNAITHLNGKTIGKRELQLNLVEEESSSSQTLATKSSQAIKPREKRPRKTNYEAVNRTNIGQ